MANPSRETLANVRHALGVTLAELFGSLEHVPLAPTGVRRVNTATPPEIRQKRLK